VTGSAQVILATLDRHLRGPASLRLTGGAALVLGYGCERATEDADIVLEDAELEALVERSDFGASLEAANRELEPQGMYLSHVFGPEQLILTPTWRESCRKLERHAGWKYLEVSVLGPLDLIVGKLARADEEDLDDIRYLIVQESLEPAAVRRAMREAMVPPILAATYSVTCQRLERLLAERPSTS